MLLQTFQRRTDFNAAWKFADAANAYKKILASDAAAPNLLFNYGNAEFKSGNLGKAIAAFRRAELFAPRDSEIRANLAFTSAIRSKARRFAKAAGKTGLTGNLSLNEWTVFAAIAFWLTFVLLAAKQIRPALVTNLKGATSIFAALTVLSGAANLGVCRRQIIFQKTNRRGHFRRSVT